MGHGRRVGVLGTLVWDTIYPFGAPAPPVERWGGIAYSLAAVAAALPPDWTAVPLVKIGEDLARPALAMLRRLPNLLLQPGVRLVPQKTNRVELRYTDAVRRCERLAGGVPAWTPGELKPLLLTLDALYLNFISGFEMDLSTAEWLRGAFHGPIYADLHSLLLSRDAEGLRTPRPLPRAERWLPCFDAVQVNEEEMSLLSVSASGEARQGTTHDVPLLLETRGGNGVRYTWNPTEMSARRWPFSCGSATEARGEVPATGGALDGDPTGCGDVWGATCYARLLAGDPLEAAIGRAHRAAARKLSHRGADGLLPHLLGGAPKA